MTGHSPDVQTLALDGSCTEPDGCLVRNTRFACDCWGKGSWNLLLDARRGLPQSPNFVPREVNFAAQVEISFGRS